MNQKQGLIIVLLLSGIFLSSCSNKNEQNRWSKSVDASNNALNEMNVVATKEKSGSGELISCDITKLNDTVTLPLSLFAHELQIVKLDNRDEALVGVTTTLVSDNYILTRNRRNTPFKLFDKNGKFLSTIGSYGQGPNEYLNVYDEYLDEKSGQIFILPWQAQKVLRFDLQGNPLEPIPLQYPVPKGKIFVNAAKSTISVFMLPFNPVPVVAWTQDFAGNMIDSIPSGHLAVSPDFSNEVQCDKNTNAFDCSLFVFYGNKPDSVYHYNIDKNKLEPRFTLDFKDRPRKIHWYSELPNHFIGNLTIEKKLTDNLSTTEYPAKFIVDKKSLKGAFYKVYNDYLGDMPMAWPTFYNGYFVENVEPGELKAKLEAQLKQNNALNEKERERLQEILDGIDENDNNYILYAKLRK